MRLAITAILLGLAGVALAAFKQCPWSNKFIQIGASLAQVLAQCDQPHTVEDTKIPRIETWTYNFSSHSLLPAEKNIYSAMLSGAVGQDAVVKLVFTNAKLSSIVRSGQNLMSFKCPHGVIQINDLPAAVSQACQKPSFTKVQQQAKDIQRWHYYANGIEKSLLFSDGVLQSGD